MSTFKTSHRYTCILQGPPLPSAKKRKNVIKIIEIRNGQTKHTHNCCDCPYNLTNRGCSVRTIGWGNSLIDCLPTLDQRLLMNWVGCWFSLQSFSLTLLQSEQYLSSAIISWEEVHASFDFYLLLQSFEGPYLRYCFAPTSLAKHWPPFSMPNTLSPLSAAARAHLNRP